MRLLAYLGLLCVAALPFLAQENYAAGRKEEMRACSACHSLRLIHSQRLTKATWERELDKMARWGAPIHDRAALLDYLVAEYGDNKPIPPPQRSISDSTASHSPQSH